MSSYSARNTPGMNRREYILFTWSKCSQCNELKKYLPRVRSVVINVKDLDIVCKDPILWNIFTSVSPSSKVPALVIVNNGMVERGILGLAPIMKALGL